MDKSPGALFAFVTRVAFHFDAFKNPIFFHFYYHRDTVRHSRNRTAATEGAEITEKLGTK
jgi:hypothetical protein